MPLDTSAIVIALVRPLVRWCMKFGMRSSAVEEIVRTIFVQEAQREIREAQGEFSVSKVSIMTGLNRGEVSRLLTTDESEVGQHDILTRVIGLWSSAKTFRDKSGNPKALTFEGVGSQFAELVSRVSREVTHYPILFELERIGAISFEGNLVKLKTREYVSTGDVKYGLELLSTDVADLTSAINANLTKEFPEPSLHLKTTYDNINPEHLAEIRRWILAKGAQFQAEMREYLSALDRDADGSEEEQKDRARVTVTTFSYAAQIVAAKQIAPRKRGRKPCKKV